MTRTPKPKSTSTRKPRRPRASAQFRRAFAARLHHARIASGLEQQSLAQRIDREPSNVSDWERGRTAPSHEDLLRIAVVTGKPIQWFYGRDGDEPEADVREIAACVMELLKALEPTARRLAAALANGKAHKRL